MYRNKNYSIVYILDECNTLKLFETLLYKRKQNIKLVGGELKLNENMVLLWNDGDMCVGVEAEEEKLVGPKLRGKRVLSCSGCAMSTDVAPFIWHTIQFIYFNF